MFKKFNFVIITIFIFSIFLYGANIDKLTQKEHKNITFIELGSKNCIPCKMMQKVMADIEKEYGDQVEIKFYDVWTEDGKPFGEKYGISAIPTQVLLDKTGKEFYRHVGFISKYDLVEVFKKNGLQTNVKNVKTTPKSKNAKGIKDGAVC